VGAYVIKKWITKWWKKVLPRFNGGIYNIHFQAGLPDGLFSNQKSQFG
jgi:hypothetical protein